MNTLDFFFFLFELHISKVLNGQAVRKIFIHINGKFVIWYLALCFPDSVTAVGVLACFNFGWPWMWCQLLCEGHWFQKPFGLNTCCQVMPWELSEVQEVQAASCWTPGLAPGEALHSSTSPTHPSTSVASLKGSWHTGPATEPAQFILHCRTPTVCQAPNS